MRCVVSYFKSHFKWIAAMLGLVFLMAFTMALNRVPWNEIFYGVLIVLLLLAVILAADGWRWKHRYTELKQMESTVTVSVDGFCETDDFVEQEYQELIRILAAEYTAEQSRARGRQKDMQEYYAMWVHQIKTPIAALRLLLQEKNGQGEMDEELAELFDIEQYVEMALQYQRLESETTDFVFERVALDGVIREAVRKYARQFIHKKISLSYETETAAAVTDGKWLRFVIEQILSNAIKYTPKGSIRIFVEEKVSGEEFSLVIEDTGIGIRAEDLPRICEKGYTGYNGHSDKHSTGIGLYLCSRILKKLGHTLTVTSQEGCGTRVEIGFCGTREDTAGKAQKK